MLMRTVVFVSLLAVSQAANGQGAFVHHFRQTGAFVVPSSEQFADLGDSAQTFEVPPGTAVMIWSSYDSLRLLNAGCMSSRESYIQTRTGNSTLVPRRSEIEVSASAATSDISSADSSEPE